MPSSPLALAASKNASPSPTTWAAKRTRGCSLEHALEQPLAVLERDVEQRPPVEIEQVERLVHEAARRRLVAELRPGAGEIGRPSSSRATTSPSTMACSASIQRGGSSSRGK